VSGTRRIAHLDMDAYYASVELLRRPELRGVPLVIGGRRGLARLADYSGRGVITTATYEARAFGLRSGMSLARAAALCPQAVLLPADFDEYRRMSRLFKDRGIDEIFIDLNGIGGEARETALAIKAAVREATGLSCSIGVAPNKLLAKLASELDKPDGLIVLEPADLAARIWPLPATRINGIGPKAGEKLAAIGIRTIGELAAADPALLVRRFGAGFGAWLHDAAHGRDERPIVTEREPKSISRETTFERDLHPRLDREALSAIFTRLCEKLAEDLRRKGYRGRSVGIKLRYDNFRTLTRDRTLEAHTDDARAIRRAAGECLRRAPLERRLRLLGVRVGSLVQAAEVSDLFG
jgi:DNA polymerase-4